MNIFQIIASWFKPAPPPDWTVVLKSINAMAGWSFTEATVDPVANPSGRSTLRLNFASISGERPTILETVAIAGLFPSDVTKIP